VRAEPRGSAAEQERGATRHTDHSTIEASGVPRNHVERGALGKRRITVVEQRVGVADDNGNCGVSPAIELVLASTVSREVVSDPLAKVVVEGEHG
jgi:hypothetical protein